MNKPFKPAIYMEYKSALQILERNKDKFTHLEAATDVNGATSIAQLKTLVTSIIEFIKSSLDAAMKPFDPASLENYMTSLQDMGTTLQVFEYTPSDMKFDSRDILDIKALSELIDDIFRCVNACWHPCFDGEFPHALCVIDLTISQIIFNAVEALEPGTKFSMNTLTGVTPTKSIITFNELKEQKYFSTEEREAIAKKQSAEREAARIAAEEEQLELKAVECRSLMKKMFSNADHYNQVDFDLVDAKTLIKGCAAITLMSKQIADDEFSAAEKGFFNTSYISDGEMTEGHFACAAEIIAMVNKGDSTPMIRNEDTYSVYSDKDSDGVVDKGNILVFFYG